MDESVGGLYIKSWLQERKEKNAILTWAFEMCFSIQHG